MFCLLQALVSRHESFIILVSMIFDILISSDEKLFCLCLLGMVFVKGFLAVVLQLVLNNFLKLVKVPCLQVKLVLALDFNFLESAIMLIFFHFLVLFYVKKVLF